MQRSRELLLLKRSEVETRNRLVFIHDIEKKISLTQIFLKSCFYKIRIISEALQSRDARERASA